MYTDNKCRGILYINDSFIHMYEFKLMGYICNMATGRTYRNIYFSDDEKDRFSHLRDKFIGEGLDDDRADSAAYEMFMSGEDYDGYNPFLGDEENDSGRIRAIAEKYRNDAGYIPDDGLRRYLDGVFAGRDYIGGYETEGESMVGHEVSDGVNSFEEGGPMSDSDEGAFMEYVNGNKDVSTFEDSPYYVEPSPLGSRKIDRRSSLFDRDKIVNRVPGEEMTFIGNDGEYYRGTSGAASWLPQVGNGLSAVEHYLNNDDNYVENRVRASEGTDSEYFVKANEDAKRLYLGYPTKYDTVWPAEYLPTIGTPDPDNTYTFMDLMTDNYDSEVEPRWAMWRAGMYTDDVLSKVGNGENKVQMHNFPILNGAALSEGHDDTGHYLSLWDKWDFNTNVFGTDGDNIRRIVGGKPFEIYDRVYLDDYYGIPEDARGNAYLVPAVSRAYSDVYGGSYGDGNYLWDMMFPSVPISIADPDAEGFF